MTTYRSMLAFALLMTCLLSACGGDEKAPVISFIGIGTGTLATDVQKIRFSQTFKQQDQSLVAAVGFSSVQSGTVVQATWFSPDERSMPMGRTSVVVHSGANVARFSFASKDPWRKAPYMLRIDAMTGREESSKTSSGSVSFFIGMKDQEIRDYVNDYQAWLRAESAERAQWDKRASEEKKMLEDVKTKLGFKAISIAARADIDGDGSSDTLVVDSQESDGAGGAASPDILASATFHQAAVVNGSGSVILSVTKEGGHRVVRRNNVIVLADLPSSGSLRMTALPSLTISFTWEESRKHCYAEIRSSGASFTPGARGCR